MLAMSVGSVALAFAYAGLLDLITIYFERKVWGRIMQRYGPSHVGFAGLLQLISDFLKYLSKELFSPNRVMKVFYYLLPLAIISIITVPLVLLPFDYVAISGLQGVLRLAGVDIDVVQYSASQFIDKHAPGIGLLGYVAIVALTMPLMYMLAWAQSNKYSALAAFRTVLMLVTYEVPFLIAIAAAAILGGVSIYEIVQKQANIWFMFLNPVLALVLFIALLAESERPPFDHPEAEQEIVHGWNVEYGAGEFILLYGLYLYSKALYAAGLITLLLLGGWLGPSIPGLPQSLTSALWFTVKLVAVFLVFIWVRASVARPRVDQILEFGWFRLLILSIIALVISIALRAGGVVP
jgi:NADH-quinone oxidoreductase subunit H